MKNIILKAGFEGRSRLASAGTGEEPFPRGGIRGILTGT
jgi:hypothetical protein